MPIDTDYTHCPDNLEGIPLASLAATNTKNAELYLATYKDASADGRGGFEDWTRTETPSCLWVQTNHPMVSMAEVTVAAADITTLPVVETNAWGSRVTITGSGGDAVASIARSADNEDGAKTMLVGTVTRPPDDQPAATDGVADSTSSSTSDGVALGGVSLRAIAMFGLGVLTVVGMI